MAVSFYLAGVTSLGEGVASSPIRGGESYPPRMVHWQKISRLEGRGIERYPLRISFACVKNFELDGRHV